MFPGAIGTGGSQLPGWDSEQGQAGCIEAGENWVFALLGGWAVGRLERRGNCAPQPSDRCAKGRALRLLWDMANA